MQFEQDKNTIRLSGVLTMGTITQGLVTDFLKLLAKNEVNSLDLSQVTQADSACVALLLKAKRFALSHQQTLELHHLPSSTQALLSLYELDQIIKPS